MKLSYSSVRVGTHVDTIEKKKNIYIYIYMGRVMVKALRYKPAGRGFDSQWCHWNFSVTLPFRSHFGPGVDSASNRNE